MQAETLNMYSAPLSAILFRLKRRLEDEDHTPVTLPGKPGIGKTEAFRDPAAAFTLL